MASQVHNKSANYGFNYKPRKVTYNPRFINDYPWFYNLYLRITRKKFLNLEYNFNIQL